MFDLLVYIPAVSLMGSFGFSLFLVEPIPLVSPDLCIRYGLAVVTVFGLLSHVHKLWDLFCYPHLLVLFPLWWCDVLSCCCVGLFQDFVVFSNVSTLFVQDLDVHCSTSG